MIKRTQIPFQEGGNRIVLPVSVTEQHYVLRSENAQTFYLYELSGETNNTVLKKEVWSRRPLGRFALVSTAPGRNFLIWLDGPLLCLSEVSPSGSQSPPAIAPNKASSAQADQVIDLTMFGGYNQFGGTRTDHCDLGILSVSVMASGEMDVTATNIFGRKFTFANESGHWTLRR